MPTVTVAMAVCNGAQTVRHALETVFAQSYTNYNVIVLDDGSTDGTKDIVTEFDVQYFQQANAGLGAARRRLTELADGEYIAFIDHDDYWLPHKLEKQLGSIPPDGVDLIHADGWYIYEDGKEVARDWSWPRTAHAWDHILPSNRVIASSAVYRREAMLDAGNFIAETVRCSDWYGWMLLAPRNRFVHVPEKLVRYNVLSTSLANAGLRFHAAQLLFLEQHFLPRTETLFSGLTRTESIRYRKMIQQNIGLALSGMARHHSKAGSRKEAREYALRALRTAPAVLKVLSRSLGILLGAG
jgi:glycosyltransferase involved in cell wall biosynthesis